MPLPVTNKKMPAEHEFNCKPKSHRKISVYR